MVGIAPSYEQKLLTPPKRGRLCRVASPDGADGSVRIHANATMYATLLDGTESVELALAAGVWPTST